MTPGVTAIPPEFAEPAFSDPWHAQVFALTVHLSEQGAFTWPDWAETFGAALAARRGDHGPLDGGADYWAAWLAALESLLAARNMAAPGDVARMRDAWAAAYLATPHGQPVTLAP
jgi:nitrile hydratase accessory protein